MQHCSAEAYEKAERVYEAYEAIKKGKGRLSEFVRFYDDDEEVHYTPDEVLVLWSQFAMALDDSIAWIAGCLSHMSLHGYLVMYSRARRFQQRRFKHAPVRKHATHIYIILQPRVVFVFFTLVQSL